MRKPFSRALRLFAIGAALLILVPLGAFGADPPDPATQPHLKSWSNIIVNANRRFVILPDFGNAAVLDRETGLT